MSNNLESKEIEKNEEVAEINIEVKELKARQIFNVIRMLKKVKIDIKKITDKYNDYTSKKAEIMKDKKRSELTEAEIIQINNNSYALLEIGVEELLFKADLAEDDLFKIVAHATGKAVKEVEDFTVTEFIFVIKKIVTQTGFMKQLKS